MSDIIPHESNTALARPVDAGGVETLVFPRLHLFQGVGKERQKYGNRKAGEYVLDLTQQVVPVGTKLVPIGVIYKWQRNDPQTKALLWRRASLRSTPPADIAGDCVWGPNGEKPLAQSIIEIICVTDACELPVVIQYKSTSLKLAKPFISAWQLLGRMYETRSKRDENVSTFCLYTLGEPKTTSNADGEWMQHNLVSAGPLLKDSPLYQIVLDMAESFSTMSEESLAASTSADTDETAAPSQTPF